MRKHFVIPDDLYERICDYRFGNRISSETAALLQLIELGLNAVQNKPEEKKIG